MSPRCPKPIGQIKSNIREAIRPRVVSSTICFSGYKGVRPGKWSRSLASSGSLPFTNPTCINPLNFSPGRGGRAVPLTRSPFRRSKRRICEEEI